VAVINADIVPLTAFVPVLFPDIAIPKPAAFMSPGVQVSPHKSEEDPYVTGDVPQLLLFELSVLPINPPFTILTELSVVLLPLDAVVLLVTEKLIPWIIEPVGTERPNCVILR